MFGFCKFRSLDLLQGLMMSNMCVYFLIAFCFIISPFYRAFYFTLCIAFSSKRWQPVSASGQLSVNNRRLNNRRLKNRRLNNRIRMRSSRSWDSQTRGRLLPQLGTKTIRRCCWKLLLLKYMVNDFFLLGTKNVSWWEIGNCLWYNIWWLLLFIQQSKKWHALNIKQSFYGN